MKGLFRLSLIAGVLMLAFVPGMLHAGSLTVGTKVIYPGGADQPPKEKDTGVSLKVDVVGVAEPDQAASTEASSSASLAEMSDNGDYEKILEAVKTPVTLEQKAWKAIALWHTGKEEQASQLGKGLLKDPSLSPDLRQKILDDMSLEDPEP